MTTIYLFPLNKKQTLNFHYLKVSNTLKQLKLTKGDLSQSGWVLYSAMLAVLNVEWMVMCLSPKSLPMLVCRYMDQKDLAAMLTSIESAGVTRKVNMMNSVHARKYVSENSTLTLKPIEEVIRSPQQGYQWWHKKDSCPPKIISKIKVREIIWHILEIKKSNWCLMEHYLIDRNGAASKLFWCNVRLKQTSKWTWRVARGWSKMGVRCRQGKWGQIGGES